MRLQPEDYQIASFAAMILLFSAGERLFPAHPVDRWKDLKLDVLSFCFALTANHVVTSMMRANTEDVTARSVAYLHEFPSVIRIVLALFVVDFTLYWIHRSQHTFTVMWRTHAWHHSIEEMYWFAGFRTSFLHSLLNSVPQVVIPITIFQLSPAEAGIGYSIGVCIQFIEHTNWRMTFGPLNWLLVTPDYHRIHHAARAHRGKNLAATFRIWDVMFGTYVNPATTDVRFALGLDDQVDRRQIPRLLAGV